MKIVRHKIRVLRAIHRMRQNELADRISISRQALSSLENEYTNSMSFDTMAELMEVFNLTSFDELFELVEVEEESLSEEKATLPETA